MFYPGDKQVWQTRFSCNTLCVPLPTSQIARDLESELSQYSNKRKVRLQALEKHLQTKVKVPAGSKGSVSSMWSDVPTSCLQRSLHSSWPPIPFCVDDLGKWKAGQLEKNKPPRSSWSPYIPAWKSYKSSYSHIQIKRGS